MKNHNWRFVVRLLISICHCSFVICHWSFDGKSLPGREEFVQNLNRNLHSSIVNRHSFRFLQVDGADRIGDADPGRPELRVYGRVQNVNDLEAGAKV